MFSWWLYQSANSVRYGNDPDIIKPHMHLIPHLKMIGLPVESSTVVVILISFHDLLIGIAGVLTLLTIAHLMRKCKAAARNVMMLYSEPESKNAGAKSAL